MTGTLLCRFIVGDCGLVAQRTRCNVAVELVKVETGAFHRPSQMIGEMPVAHAAENDRAYLFQELEALAAFGRSDACALDTSPVCTFITIGSGLGSA